MRVGRRLGTLHCCDARAPPSPAGYVRHLGVCPDTGLHLFVRSGLYGPYVQRGRDDDPLFRRQALPKVRRLAGDGCSPLAGCHCALCC